MAVNLESHGLPVGLAYGNPVTVQDQQGQSHGQQQPAQDAGYGKTSAFEPATAGASVPQAAVEDPQASGSGDLLSKLSGFIRAVGDVVVQLGEYLRTAGGAVTDSPAAPAAQAQVLAPGTPAGAPVPAAPGAPQAPAASAQLATAAVLPSQPRQTSPALGGTRSSEPTSSRDAAKVAASGLGETTATPQAATAGLRGGGRASQPSLPVLNPLPPYLGDQLAFIDFGASEPEAQLPEAKFPIEGGEALHGHDLGEALHDAAVGLSASARPPVQPTYSVQQVAAAQAVQETSFTNNVIPFPGPAARDALAGEASNETTGDAARPEASLASQGYAAVLFRPAFYGNLRC